MLATQKDIAPLLQMQQIFGTSSRVARRVRRCPMRMVEYQVSYPLRMESVPIQVMFTLHLVHWRFASSEIWISCSFHQYNFAQLHKHAEQM